MEIKSLLANRIKSLSESYQNDTKNDTIKDEEWKVLGKELSEHFKYNLFWVPWKYEMWMIYEAFKSAGDKGYRYFLGALTKKKKEYEERGKELHP